MEWEEEGGGGENYGEGEEIKIVIHIVVYSTCTYVHTYVRTCTSWKLSLTNISIILLLCTL